MSRNSPRIQSYSGGCLSHRRVSLPRPKGSTRSWKRRPWPGWWRVCASFWCDSAIEPSKPRHPGRHLPYSARVAGAIERHLEISLNRKNQFSSGTWGAIHVSQVPYQRVGGPVRSLLRFRVLNAFRLYRGAHKAKGIRHKAKVGSGCSTPCGITEVGISCLLPFTFCLSGCPRRHGRRRRAEADPQCAREGHWRGTPLLAQALLAMRLVLLESAIQNPKSRIQNRVPALRRS